MDNTPTIHMPSRNPQQDPDELIRPLKKEDLIWASLDADSYDKYYKKPPPYIPSQTIYKEYTYSLGEIPFGEKKMEKPLLSPLLPKELNDLSIRQRSQVLHGASKRKFGPLKLKKKSNNNTQKPFNPTEKFVGRRSFKRNRRNRLKQQVPREIKNEPIDWNHPEYINTPNLFYKCSNPDTFFRGNLERSKISTLLKDRKLKHHGQYQRVSKRLSQIIESGVDNMPGFDRDSAYLPTGVVRSKKNDPSYFLPGYGSSSDIGSKRLELSILRNIATRERAILRLRENCHTSLMSGDGTFAMRIAIQNAKKALRLKQLRKTCDNIRQASLKILLEINEWRLCMKKLEEDTFYEMNVNADSMANQQHNHTVAGSNIPRSSNNTIADFFQIGMPITPLTPNTLDFSNWTPQEQYYQFDQGEEQLLPPLNDDDKMSHSEAKTSITPTSSINNMLAKTTITPSTVSNHKIVYSRIQMPPRSFFYKGENYTTKMKHDMDFMDGIMIKDGQCISSMLDLYPTFMNPLLFPASLEELAGNLSIKSINKSQIPLRQKEYGGLNMYELREGASILLDDFKYLDEVAYFDYVEDVNNGFKKEIYVSTTYMEPSKTDKIVNVSQPNTDRSSISNISTTNKGDKKRLTNKERNNNNNTSYVIRLVEKGTQTDDIVILEKED